MSSFITSVNPNCTMVMQLELMNIWSS